MRKAFVRRVFLLVAAALLGMPGCKSPRGGGTPPEPDAGVRNARTDAESRPGKADAEKQRSHAAESSEEDAVPEISGVDGEDELVSSPPVRQAKEAPADPLDEKLKKLKFKARREVMWARAAMSNIESYRADLKKFERDFAEWELPVFVPDEPKLDEVKKLLYDLAGARSIVIEYYEAKPDTMPRKPLPKQIRGDRDFSYEEEDIRDLHQVVMRVVPPDADSMRGFLKDAAAAKRLVHVRKVSLSEQRLVVNLTVYSFRKLVLPVHVAEERSIERELKSFGIEKSMEELQAVDSVGHLQNATLSYAEFNASIPKVNEALGLLGQGQYLAARSEFFRRTFEAAQRDNGKALESNAIDAVVKKR